MYKSAYYNDVEKDQMIAFAKEQSFAIVTGIGAEFPVATRLPLEVEEQDGKLFLSGHMMRKTDHHAAFERNPNVLIIFTSPQAYIRADWYADPKSGSTVNYISVHAKGKIFFRDEAGTEKAVRNITDKYIGKDSAASFDALPKEYISSMVKAIAGFRIDVENMEAVFKLSQNKAPEDRENIIEQLESRGTPGDLYIAGKMKTIPAK